MDKTERYKDWVRPHPYKKDTVVPNTWAKTVYALLATDGKLYTDFIKACKRPIGEVT